MDNEAIWGLKKMRRNGQRLVGRISKRRGEFPSSFPLSKVHRREFFLLYLSHDPDPRDGFSEWMDWWSFFFSLVSLKS